MEIEPDELALYMGAQTVNEARARLLLTLAVQACEEIARPLPEGARGVVLDVASTAYVAPPGPGGQQNAGPYGAPLPPGGVVLSRRQERRLKRLSGQGAGAFSVTTGPGSSRLTGGDFYPLDRDPRTEFLP